MPSFALADAFFQAGVLLCYWLFYETLVRLAGFHGTVMLRLVFVALAFSFLFSSALSSRRDGPLVQALYTLSAVWVGFFHFLFWSSVLCWGLYGARMALGLGRYPASWARASLSLGLAMGLFGIVNARRPRIKKIDIAIRGQAGEEGGFSSVGGAARTSHGRWAGRTAVFISDLHLGTVRGLGFARQVAARIRRIGPDMLLLGGDFFDGGPADAEALIAPFSEIITPLGAYFIMGNHEEFSEANRMLVQAAKEAGMKVLDNRVHMADGLQIAGVSYSSTLTRAGYERTLQAMGLRRELPVLLLKHSPVHPEISLQEGVSLELCGHTHKGQIIPYNLVTRLVYGKFDGGLRRLGGLTVYTSAGAGTWGPPMRVGNRPEIVLIRFV